eukprot:g38560.t1
MSTALAPAVHGFRFRRRSSVTYGNVRGRWRTSHYTKNCRPHWLEQSTHNLRYHQHIRQIIQGIQPFTVILRYINQILPLWILLQLYYAQYPHLYLRNHYLGIGQQTTMFATMPTMFATMTTMFATMTIYHVYKHDNHLCHYDNHVSHNENHQGYNHHSHGCIKTMVATMIV